MKSLVLGFFVVSFLFTYSAQAQPPKKTPPKAARSGIVEQAYEKTVQEHVEILTSALEIVTEIDKGSSEWRPIDPKLYEVIKQALKSYNHTHLDAMTAQRVEAQKTIKDALANSEEFRGVSDTDLGNMVRELVRHSRRSRVTTVNAKHLLYAYTVELEINRSPKLAAHLKAIAALMERTLYVREREVKLERFLENGLKNIATLDELKARGQKALAALDKYIPANVVAKVAELGKQYTDAQHPQGFDVLTGGQNDAMESFEKFAKDEPFFKAFSAEQMGRFQFEWTRATNKPQAVFRLASLLKENDEVQTLYRELSNIDDAIQLLSPRK